MSVVFPFSLNGNFFSIKTVLKEEQGEGYKIQESEKTRLLQPGFLLSNRNTSKVIGQKLVSLVKQLKLKIVFAYCTYEALMLFFPDGSVINLPWLFEEKLKHLDQKLVGRSGLETQTLNKFVVNLILPNTFAEQQALAVLINDQLQKVYKLSRPFDLLVCGGELVWSGWLAGFQLVNSLLLSDLEQMLIKIDGHGIFEYLLCQPQADKTIYKISKDLLFPDLRFLNLKAKNKFGNKIRINNSQNDKQISIEANSNSLFDLGADDYQISSDRTIVPRYFLLKNRDNQGILEKSFIKQRNLLQGNFCKVTTVIPYLNMLDAKVERILLTCPGVLVSEVKLGVELHVNDIKWRLANREIIKLPRDFILSVVDGQLVSEGGELAYIKNSKNKRIKAKSAGKTSLNLFKSGYITIENVLKAKTVALPISGKVLSLVNQASLVIETLAYSIPLETKGQAGGVMIRLSSLKNMDKFQQESMGFPLIVLVDTFSASDTKLLTELIAYPGLIVGFILKKYNQEIISQYQHLNPEIVWGVLESHSDNCNPIAEALLQYYQGRYITIASGKLILPSELLFGAENLLNEKRLNTPALRGRSVKSLNFQSQFLYGKIEKSLEKQGTVLVNTPEGFIETRLENIYFID